MDRLPGEGALECVLLENRELMYHEQEGSRRTTILRCPA